MRFEMDALDARALQDVFPSEDIEWRIQRIVGGGDSALALAYVTNRAIMNRLDSVVGPENWANVFEEGPEGGVLCGISICIGNEWVTKWDGAENTDIEAVKGGLSGAMKRAAVQWGIGRFLYNLDETWVNYNDDGDNYAKAKDGSAFLWNDPELPAWARPVSDGGKSVTVLDMLTDRIKTNGTELVPNAKAVISGYGDVMLKSFVKDNWDTVRGNYRLAREVAAKMEELAAA